MKEYLRLVEYKRAVEENLITITTSYNNTIYLATKDEEIKMLSESVEVAYKKYSDIFNKSIKHLSKIAELEYKLEKLKNEIKKSDIFELHNLKKKLVNGTNK